jgi:hypothetical protein
VKATSTRSCIHADRSSSRPSKKARISALDMTHGKLSRILRIDYAGNSRLVKLSSDFGGFGRVLSTRHTLIWSVHGGFDDVCVNNFYPDAQIGTMASLRPLTMSA